VPAETSVKTGKPSARDGSLSQAAGDGRLITNGPGMIMALALFHATHGTLTLAAGYESGHAVVFQHAAASNRWTVIYSTQAHTQPILSLDVDRPRTAFFTSSADALIAKHPIPAATDPALDTTQPRTVVQTKHAGQQGLSVRSDGRLFATAGWDARVRVYSTKTVKELAVLKWHTEGCYAVAFAAIQEETTVDSALDERVVSTGWVSPASIGEAVVRGVERRRIDRASTTHWVAAGSKDGKVSLWDIY
jgi:WD40 repeat protein